MKVQVEKKDSVCTVIINRPESRNAVDRETAEQLVAAFEEFERDDSLLAAVLWGRGGNFCAGADLKAITSGDLNKINSLEWDMSKPGPLGPSRMTTTKPVIAAVSGHAVAGGLELACWCDLRVVERDAYFGVFCRRYGVPLIDGGTQRLPRLIGEGLAKELIYSSSNLKAYDAYRVGLVNHIYQSAELMNEAKKLAGKIARQATVAVGYSKTAINRGMQVDIDTAMQIEADLFGMCFATEDQKEGMKAFIEKRKPAFKSR